MSKPKQKKHFNFNRDPGKDKKTIRPAGDKVLLDHRLSPSPEQKYWNWYEAILDRVERKRNGAYNRKVGLKERYEAQVTKRQAVAYNGDEGSWSDTSSEPGSAIEERLPVNHSQTSLLDPKVIIQKKRIERKKAVHKNAMEALKSKRNAAIKPMTMLESFIRSFARLRLD